MRPRSWSELLAAWAEERRSLGRSQATVATVCRAGRAFAAFFSPERAMAEVQLADLEAYRRSLEARGLARVSVTGELGRLQTVLRWAVRQGWLLLDPTRGLGLRRERGAWQPCPTLAQVQALLEAPPGHTARGLRDRAVLELFYGTGLRLGEVLALDLADLDGRERTLTVRRGKNQRPRLAPLGAHLAQVLETYLEQGRPRLVKDPHERALFVSTRGRRWEKRGLERMVAGYARCPGLTPHALRRAFASHLLSRGARLAQVQALLGHRLATSTEPYLEISWAQLTGMLARTHPRGGRGR